MQLALGPGYKNVSGDGYSITHNLGFGGGGGGQQDGWAGFKTAAAQQPSQFAGVLGNNYGAYGNALAGLGNAYTNAFGAYGAGLGTMATAQANARSAQYASNAQAEAARQLAAGNIGSSALGAYGGAANSAMGAWAANQQAYNQAAATMHQANQSGLSNYGISRNQALGSLGGAYSGVGRAQIGAGAVAGMNLGGGGGGGGFSATGSDGPVASGSYGGGGGGGSSPRPGGGGGEAALAGLRGLQESLMSRDIPRDLLGEAQRGRQQLDMQHYTSRGMPSQMLDQTLAGIRQLGSQGYDSLGSGMNQFYGAQEQAAKNGASSQAELLRSLQSGYGTVGGQLGGVQRDLGSGFAEANRGVRDLWDSSWGNNQLFATPARQAALAREAAIESRRNNDLAEIDRLTRERDLAATRRPKWTYGDMMADPDGGAARRAAWLQPDIDRLGRYV